MPFDPRKLLSIDIPETVQSYGPRDCALYALGVGLGADPLDERQLAFARAEGRRVVPTMATVLGYQGFWLEQVAPEIDLAQVLHGEQGICYHAPLPTAATIRRMIRVVGVVDKGADKGALVLTEESIVDAETGKLLAGLTSSIMCRGNGGMGSEGKTSFAGDAVPTRRADGVRAIPGFLQQALIYRLSGDDNPLHADPAFARAAGFPGPVLHGLASYGTACQTLLLALCDGDPARFRAMDARFTRPVFPGEPLEISWWIEAAGTAAFRVRQPDRNVVAIDNGLFTYV